MNGLPSLPPLPPLRTGSIYVALALALCQLIDYLVPFL